MTQESIEVVIERCRERINMSLNCNAGDILRLCNEVERLRERNNPQQPPWHGFGSGD